jgi:PEP-CTERM motif
MRHLMKLSALGVGAAIAFANPAQAATLYSQNFESPVTTSANTVGPGAFVQSHLAGNADGSGWEVQGGGGGTGITQTGGVDTNGVGGSQALFALEDQSTASGFTFNQYTHYGITGPGAGTTLSQIQISMDIFMSGSTTTNPIGISYTMNASPTATTWTFIPTLANDVYTHVVFTLDQATPNNANAFDPTINFNLQVNHGSGGFGFDTGNVVRIDNVLVQTPEPASMGLLSLVGVAGLRRRR